MYPGLKKLREERGLTQRQAAALVKVHPLTWSKWERCEQCPSAQAALLIEMVIKFVPLREIVERNLPPPTKKKPPRERTGLRSLSPRLDAFDP
jgi:transcriptional regulator with XRE-family HTH domain